MIAFRFLSIYNLEILQESPGYHLPIAHSTLAIAGFLLVEALCPLISLSVN